MLGGIYHIINRGNMKMQVFDCDEDYEIFLDFLKRGMKKENIELHAYCLMPNHFHLLVVPKTKKALSRFMQWVMTSHVRFYHKKNATSGHIWQGRYKSFIVEQESYYISVLRYIEANAKRAGLVEKAQDWNYSSLHERVLKSRVLLNKPYIELPDDWMQDVNCDFTVSELSTIRNSVNRQAPLGEQAWQEKVAFEYGLQSTLNKRGRPKKKDKETQK
jgi:putative transposase